MVVQIILMLLSSPQLLAYKVIKWLLQLIMGQEGARRPLRGYLFHLEAGRSPLTIREWMNILADKLLEW